MKTLVAFILLGYTSVAYSGDNKITILSQPLIINNVMDKTDYNQIRSKIMCVDGYKYLVTWGSNSATGPSVVQMFKRGYSYSEPVKCGE